MRNRKMLIAGLITVVMGISIVGCGNDGKSTRETESTEQVTETEMATEEESEAEDTGDTESVIHMQMKPITVMTVRNPQNLRCLYMRISHWHRDSARITQILTIGHLYIMERNSL